jgi:hypothetical protein
MPVGQLMQALLSSRTVIQPTQIQPAKGTVQRVWYKTGDIARQPGADEGYSIHATRDILTAPVWGATTPNAFITIHGVPPRTPTVAHVATVAGSNAPQGGSCK